MNKDFDYRLDMFIDKNYEKIRKNYYKEGRELGYSNKELKGYFYDCKRFTFCGTLEQLKQDCKSEYDYHIIAQENDLVIAELFNGKEYYFI